MSIPPITTPNDTEAVREVFRVEPDGKSYVRQDATYPELVKTLATLAAEHMATRAEVERLRELLLDTDKLLALCDQGRAGKIRDHMDDQAMALGHAHGFGAWMDSFQRAWQSIDPVGCSTVGPCLATVHRIRKRIAAACGEGA